MPSPLVVLSALPSLLIPVGELRSSGLHLEISFLGAWFLQCGDTFSPLGCQQGKVRCPSTNPCAYESGLWLCVECLPFASANTLAAGSYSACSQGGSDSSALTKKVQPQHRHYDDHKARYDRDSDSLAVYLVLGLPAELHPAHVCNSARSLEGVAAMHAYVCSRLQTLSDRSICA